MQILFFIASVLVCVSVNGEKIIMKLPLDKATVHYHHRKICITVGGEERCIQQDMEPGDPERLAQLFKVIQEYEIQHEGDTERNDEKDGDKSEEKGEENNRSKEGSRSSEEKQDEDIGSNTLHLPEQSAPEESLPEQLRLRDQDRWDID